ncbi:MAG: 6-phosphofructokinase, partial [Flavobacteriales bacterium]|nr:6-phosphofructokinase [Flavobacteriales bacterium]
MKTIAVFTSGGDSPGMNACIRAIVRTALHHGVKVYGIMHGYQGMIEDQFRVLGSDDVGNIIQRGGTILKSSRSKEFLTTEGRQKAFENIQKRGIEGIIAIGGDGTFAGAKVFTEEHNIP